MYAEAVQSGPQIDQTGAIEAQAHDGGASCGGNADDFCCIITPREMIRPLLLTRMEQGDFLLRHGIAPRLKRTLETVAAQAGQGKIGPIRCAPFRFRDDMLDGERIGMKAAQTAAILTLSVGAFVDKSFEGDGNVGLRHDRLRQRDL